MFRDATNDFRWGSQVELPPALRGTVATLFADLRVGDGGVDEMILTGSYSMCGYGLLQSTRLFYLIGTKYEDVSNTTLPTAVQSASGAVVALRSAVDGSLNVLMVNAKTYFLRNLGNGSFVDNTNVLFPGTFFYTNTIPYAIATRAGVAAHDVVLMTPYSFDLFLQIGNGTYFPTYTAFPTRPPSSGNRVAVADVDANGAEDLIVLSYYAGMVNDSYYLSVYANMQSNGTFLGYHDDSIGEFRGCVVADRFFGSPHIDIAAYVFFRNTDLTPKMILLRGQGNFSFVNSTVVPNIPKFNVFGPGPLGCTVAAYRSGTDNSAPADLFVSGDLDGSNVPYSVFWQNDGTGNFTALDIPQIAANYSKCSVLASTKYAGHTLLALTQVDSSYGDFNQFLLINSGSYFVYTTSILSGIQSSADGLSRSSLVTGDVNGDGCADLIVQGLTSRNSLVSDFLLGACNGSAASLLSPFLPCEYGVSILSDLNSDGFADIFVAGEGYHGFEPSIYFQAPNGSFNRIAGMDNSTFQPAGMELFFEPVAAIFDYDGDGHPDIASSSCTYYLSDFSLFRSFGNGSFLDVTSATFAPSPPKGLCFGNMLAVGAPNSTQYADMLMVGGEDRNILDRPKSAVYFRNLRNGTLVNYTIEALPAVPYAYQGGTTVAADFSGDGLLDLFTSSAAGTRLFLGRENRTFVVGNLGMTFGPDSNCDATAADFDSDGMVDIAYYGSAIPLTVLRNIGNGSFEDASSALLPASYPIRYGSISAADYNVDGIADLVVLGQGSCGNLVLVSSITATENVTLLTSVAVGTGGGGDSLSTSAILGIAIGGGGFLIGLVLVAAFLIFIVCACCVCVVCMCGIFCAIAVVAVVVLAAAVAGGGSATATVFVMRRRGAAASLPSESDEPRSMEELRNLALQVKDVQTIPWDELHFVKKLGEGAFGEVLQAEWCGADVAVKVFRPQARDAVDEFHREALAMARVSYHPHVVRLVGISIAADHAQLALVMGLCTGGSLIERLRASPPLDDLQRVRIAREVASALAFLHSLGIVHRDIAARNVLLDGRDSAKLADLGLSRVLADDVAEQTTASSVGPVRWMAPECLSARSYSAASDSYSFGVLLCEIWSNGALPLAHYASVADVAVAVLRRGERPHLPDTMPESVAEWVQRLLATDIGARPSMLATGRFLDSLHEGAPVEGPPSEAAATTAYQSIHNPSDESTYSSMHD